MHDTKTDRTRPDRGGLRDIATQQKGYFTAAQARARGFESSNLSHRTSRGSLIRITHGLYRLPDFPHSPREDVMSAWLAAGREHAVVSHESALEIHGLSDIVPRTVHITLPRERRWYTGGSNVTVHTTTSPIPEADIVVREGMRVTSPERSIADAAEWGTSVEHVEAAVRDALRSGSTTSSRIERHAAERGGRVESILRRAIERAGAL